MTVIATKIPALRFSEFEGEWEEKKLGEIADFFDSKRVPLSELERQDKKGVYPYYGASGIIDYVDDFIFDGTYVLLGEDGANIISRSTRLAFVVVGKIWVNNHAHVIKSFGNDYFLAEALEKIRYEQYNTGTVQPKLNADICKKIKLHIPPFPEQQKIATFLTTIDTRIQQLSRKKALLEQYKKGVMQQIFSQQIRFKDEEGKGFPAWEELELCEVAIRVLEKNRDNAVTFVLTNSATQGIVSQQDYFDKDIANPNNLEGYYVVQMDDFVYNPRISSSAPVGPIKRNKLAKGVMSPLYTVFRFKNHNIRFFEYFFETTQWHFYMKSIANYGIRHDRMNITNADFIKMPVPMPALEEQQKIAAFLSAVDVKIDQANQQLNRMQTFKKGLLQQMFV